MYLEALSTEDAKVTLTSVQNLVRSIAFKLEIWYDWGPVPLPTAPYFCA